jgi:hypothetical protein
MNIQHAPQHTEEKDELVMAKITSAKGKTDIIRL